MNNDQPYLNHFNYSDVFLRNLQLALLHHLNKKLTIDYITNDEICSYTIPFFLGSFSGAGERFWQDMFQSDERNNTITNKYVEGDVSPVPRGVVTMDTITLNPSEFTNKFIPANVTKKDWKTGQVKSISTSVNVLQMNITFSVIVKCNTLIELYKVWERFLNEFYKIHQMEFNYDGAMMTCWVGFGENTDIKNTYEFSFADVKEKEIGFNIEVQCYYPVFDKTTAIPSSRRINQFIVNLGETFGVEDVTEEYGVENLQKEEYREGLRSAMIEQFGLNPDFEMTPEKLRAIRENDEEALASLKLSVENKDLLATPEGHKLAVNPKDKTKVKYQNLGDSTSKPSNILDMLE